MVFLVDIYVDKSKRQMDDPGLPTGVKTAVLSAASARRRSHSYIRLRIPRAAIFGNATAWHGARGNEWEYI